MELSVVVPTHNPDPGRLRRTLEALERQTLAASAWEILVIDNASAPPLNLPAGNRRVRVVPEPELGLTHARRRGLREARGAIVVLVDDDNVLAPDYLDRVVALFAAHPGIGAMGGRSEPEFEQPPPAWVREFDGLLACRDLGADALVSHGLRAKGAARAEYPLFAPIGAGFAARREALATWLATPADGLTDRRGGELSSGGDNDIVLTLMEHGWEVGYFPDLRLTHLIPVGRTNRDYLARLNRGIAKSWVQVLAKHQACPWGKIAPWTVKLRQAKAWFAYRAWAGPAAFVRWQGACGHFEGRAT